MKVVHLNTYDGNGGAGRAGLRLNKALNGQGIHSEIWVNYKFGKDPSIRSLNPKGFSKAFAAFGILLERFVSSAFAKRLKIPFSIPVWGKDISNHPAVQNADIIHLHWVNHAFLRPKDIARLKKLNKPIVWTFHDSNAFTGGCHVRYSCNHYQKECGNCPLLKQSGPEDLSHKIWESKKDAYRQLYFSVVAPSKWIFASIRASKLLGTADAHIIPNTLDTAIFRPHDKALAKKYFDLSPDKFIMLSGFMPSRKDLHKGTPYLLKALEILTRVIGVDKEEIELVVFGNRDEKNVPDFPVKTTFLGTISNDEKLAICYNAADVFLTPSLEDNLPNTVMESLSCGTPVVAFTTGGIPDMVTHQVNGYLADYQSSHDFAEGIRWIFNHPERENLNKKARKIVEERFSEPVIAAKHIELYKSLTREKKGLNMPSFAPVLSVITVVYNNVKDIERTINSVLNQTYPNIEYIVIDGNSTDGTLEVISKYENKISKIVSENDNGIYDAMNKGLALATGDYILFMNSGDELYSTETVELVFATETGADIYYGETEMYNEQWESLGRRRHKSPEKLDFYSFRYGMSVSHQAIYIKRQLIEPYDLNYSLSSDIDWILRALKKAKRVVNTRMYVAKYLVGGMSKKKHRESLKERFHIFTKHYGLIPNLLNHAVIAFNLFFYYLKHRRTND